MIRTHGNKELLNQSINVTLRKRKNVIMKAHINEQKTTKKYICIDKLRTVMSPSPASAQGGSRKSEGPH